MKEQLKNLLVKIDKIERQLKDINKFAEKYSSGSYMVKRNDFLNFSAIEEEKLKIASINVNNGQNILFECLLEVVASSAEQVEFSLIVDEVVIAKIKKDIVVGVNNISLSQDYLSQKDNGVDVFVVVNPLEKKQIIILGCTLNVWGVESERLITKYSVLDVGDKYLLSFLKDQSIYYKIITKQLIALNEIDFDFCARALSFSFVYNKSNAVLYLCRVDLDGNLFIDNFESKKYVLIDQGVQVVSATSSEGGLIVCYIKNNQCFVCEFENENVYSVNKISYNFIIKNCNIFYNEYSGVFFLILSMANGKNIMLESSEKKASVGENIKAEYMVEVEVYEVSNED